MSNKISNFFKIEPKFNSESCLNSGSSVEVKKEREDQFDIILSELKSIEEMSINQPKTWECRVNLQNIKEEIQNGTPKINKRRTIPRHSVKNSSNSIPIKAHMQQESKQDKSHETHEIITQRQLTIHL